MGEFGDALGSAIEGGLYANALEPQAGKGSKGHTHEGACLNCGTALVGPHCHACGQRAHVHRTMGAFFHDLLHGVLHADGKTFRTLPLLALKPGELTRRYIAGERARFVSPMALFLFAVFLMFAVFQLAGISPPANLGPPVQLGAEGSAIEATQKRLEELRKARAGLEADNPAAPVLDVQIAALEQRLGNDPTPATPVEESAAPAARGVVPSAEGAPPAIATGDIGDSFDIENARTGIAFVDHAIDKWRDNPSLMAYKLQSNSYKFSWLLIPLSVPFVWLLFFWRRRFGAYDHAVFVTYSLAFMTLFYVVLVLLGGIGVAGGWLTLLGTSVPLLHIYKQLKGSYELTRFSALWRTGALGIFIFVILFLFIDLLLVLGAF